MSRRTVGIIAVNLLLFGALAELVGLAAYYVDHGALFYGARPPYERIQENDEGRLTGDALHPYFGPTHAPGFAFNIPDALRDPDVPLTPRLTNNFGFVSPHNYPFTKTSDRQYVIGLFGGSVGVWFCQLGADRLMSQLRQNPYFRNRELVPLCFSHEGYKQPQHLLVLAYFLSIGQTFDLVVNIDGLNEVALGELNHQHGFDVSMPSFQHMDPLINVLDRSTLTPEKLRSLAAIDAYKERLNSLATRLADNHSAAINFVLERLYERTLDDYHREQGRFANLPSNPRATSVVRVTPEVEPREGVVLFEAIAQQWARASLQMNDMLASLNVPYFHFLQPNQYYTVRRFSADEARVAKSDASPFKRSVEQGYPVLTGPNGAGSLKGKIRYFDATHAFDTEPSAVYMDNCCHYTLAGNHRLADFVADAILHSAGPWASGGSGPAMGSPRVGQ